MNLTAFVTSFDERLLPTYLLCQLLHWFSHENAICTGHLCAMYVTMPIPYLFDLLWGDSLISALVVKGCVNIVVWMHAVFATEYHWFEFVTVTLQRLSKQTITWCWWWWCFRYIPAITSYWCESLGLSVYGVLTCRSTLHTLPLGTVCLFVL